MDRSNHKDGAPTSRAANRARPVLLTWMALNQDSPSQNKPFCKRVAFQRPSSMIRHLPSPFVMTHWWTIDEGLAPYPSLALQEHVSNLSLRHTSSPPQRGDCRLCAWCLLIPRSWSGSGVRSKFKTLMIDHRLSSREVLGESVWNAS